MSHWIQIVGDFMVSLLYNEVKQVSKSSEAAEAQIISLRGLSSTKSCEE